MLFIKNNLNYADIWSRDIYKRIEESNNIRKVISLNWWKLNTSGF